MQSNLNKLRKTPELLTHYDTVIKDQQKRDFIEIIPKHNNDSHKVHYIPHHCVVKDSKTTPIRIVFDCSAKTGDNLSLNDCLQTGPCLINEMVEVLLRFRAYKYACVSDIEKAYLMVYLES
jgi:hypothetical protein